MFKTMLVILAVFCFIANAEAKSFDLYNLTKNFTEELFVSEQGEIFPYQNKSKLSDFAYLEYLKIVKKIRKSNKTDIQNLKIQSVCNEYCSIKNNFENKEYHVIFDLLIYKNKNIERHKIKINLLYINNELIVQSIICQ